MEARFPCMVEEFGYVIRIFRVFVLVDPLCYVLVTPLRGSIVLCCFIAFSLHAT
jgi:hypothetical protein